MKKFVTQQQQLFITKTENEFVKQVNHRFIFYQRISRSYLLGIRKSRFRSGSL